MRTVGELVGQMRDGAREVLSLAFFYFAAIAAERLFVSRVAIFVGADAPAVLPLTAAIVLAAIVGFLLRPYLVYRFADDHGRRVTSDVMGTLAVAAPVVVIMARQFAAMLAGSLVAACALGYAGSAAHAGMARKFGRSSGAAACDLGRLCGGCDDAARQQRRGAGRGAVAVSLHGRRYRDDRHAARAG